MERTDLRYQAYVDILREELIAAMGCTEPIALAYAAATARELLGAMPERVRIQASPSIIKNVKSVIVPNTGGLKGMPAAAAAGIVAGEADKKLEVISQVTPEQQEEMRACLEQIAFQVEMLDTEHDFELLVTLERGEDSVLVHILDHHTNIVGIEKNGKVLLECQDSGAKKPEHRTDRSLLNMEDIYDFITTMDPQDVQEILDRQIAYNTAIADEGLRNDYGANVGKVLLEAYGDGVKNRAKARAAAASDARMSGCELPVVINSGSGNQGITCSVPVIEYAKEVNASQDKLYRALALSNLTAIHLKTGIGTLSAYCGAVSAGAAAGAGIAYLTEGSFDVVKHTVVNALAVVSGILCDGAKPSCAAKIAAAIDGALLGLDLYRSGQQFYNGDGIVMRNIEETVRGVGIIGKYGMRSTNEEIIHLMLGDE
ncbi:hypothetical protein B5G43_01525 [Flavonifractor sp. An92]|uniref:L-cysteine desulfidase family protein n=1 Tax=Flavonifractor sp. An92 TaxID=1965666 RepID=UPI000B398C94|nr:L-serine ammonia-lyase, iron-sulfur-dependent, subunit alpha [Flavonifractor sp. An92]OUN08785.1 hypothetical protein B5G43_01525 [Flavonifractor sp. An92]